MCPRPVPLLVVRRIEPLWRDAATVCLGADDAPLLSAMPALDDAIAGDDDARWQLRLLVPALHAARERLKIPRPHQTLTIGRADWHAAMRAQIARDALVAALSAIGTVLGPAPGDALWCCVIAAARAHTDPHTGAHGAACERFLAEWWPALRRFAALADPRHT